MKKKYYVYAGYYEIWITDRILRRPLAYLGSHRTMEAAYRHALRKDPEAICFDESIKEEATEFFCDLYCVPDPERIKGFPTFNGQDYAIENGLTDITNLHFKKAGKCLPCPLDYQDIVEWLHFHTKKSRKSLREFIHGKTYDELRPAMSL